MVPKISGRKAGIFGILSPLIALVFISIAIYLNPWFVLSDNALSDLGAIGESYNYVFDIGIILTGFTNILFSFGLQNLKNTRIGHCGATIYGVGVSFLLLVGVFPLGTSPHSYVAVISFLLATLAIILIGIDQALAKQTRPWGIFALSIVVLGIISFILVHEIPYNLGAAIPEIIGASVFSEFSIIYGARLITDKTQ